MMPERHNPRRVQWAALAAFALIIVGQVWSLAGIARSDRALAMRLATPYTAKGEPQETPLDWLQEPPYAVALALCIGMVVRLWRRPDRTPYWALLGFLVAFLLWRELPWSERVVGATTFSWPKYLGRADVTLWGKIVFGGGSMAATLGIVLYVIVRRRAILALAREKLFALSTLLVVLAGGTLLAGQVLDKHRSADYLLGTHFSVWDLKDYLEESLEWVGPTLLLLAAVMAILEEETAADAKPQAGAMPRPT